jgi:Uma2 family endonuclease
MNKEGGMTTFVIESEQVSVPEWVKDLASFRRWADSDEFPETGRICYFGGEVWVDMSKEQVFTHVLVKTRMSAVLSELVEAGGLGLFLGDGVLVSNIDADIAVVPDAVFASTAALQDRVRLIEGKNGGYVELEGSPDMVLEVVSDGSVRKDTRTLREDYWRAGVREYWLVDARPDPLTFDILRYTPRGYRATPKKDSWLRSAVFDRSFRLVRALNALGNPKFTLEVR